MAEALELLSRLQPRARLIAGGTDLLLELTRGQRPEVSGLIDLSRLSEMQRIELVDDRIVIGAGVTHNEIVTSALVGPTSVAVGPSLLGGGLTSAPQPGHRGWKRGDRLPRQRHHHPPSGTRDNGGDRLGGPELAASIWLTSISAYGRRCCNRTRW